jgi:hypothetical protein
MQAAGCSSGWRTYWSVAEADHRAWHACLMGLAGSAVGLCNQAIRL